MEHLNNRIGNKIQSLKSKILLFIIYLMYCQPLLKKCSIISWCIKYHYKDYIDTIYFPSKFHYNDEFKVFSFLISFVM